MVYSWNYRCFNETIGSAVLQERRKEITYPFLNRHAIQWILLGNV